MSLLRSSVALLVRGRLLISGRLLRGDLVDGGHVRLPRSGHRTVVARARWTNEPRRYLWLLHEGGDEHRLEEDLVSDDSVYRVSEGGLLQLRSGVRRWGGRSVWRHKHKLSTR